MALLTLGARTKDEKELVLPEVRKESPNIQVRAEHGCPKRTPRRLQANPERAFLPCDYCMLLSGQKTNDVNVFLYFRALIFLFFCIDVLENVANTD